MVGVVKHLCTCLHSKLLSGHDVMQEVPHLEGGQVQQLVSGIIIIFQLQAENELISQVLT